MTVTDDGSAGRSRDQRTGTSPILGKDSRPLAVTANRALRVNKVFGYSVLIARVVP
jgi:hypothetical protein